MDELDVGHDAPIGAPGVGVLHEHAILEMVLAMHVLAHPLEHGALQHDAVGATGGVDVAKGELVETAGIAVRRNCSLVMVSP